MIPRVCVMCGKPMANRQDNFKCCGAECTMQAARRLLREVQLFGKEAQAKFYQEVTQAQAEGITLRELRQRAK